MSTTSHPRIRLLRTSHVIYQHADFAKARQFLLDFGFTIAEERKSPGEIFFQGYGSEPFLYVAREAVDGKNKFLGAAYVVESREELVRATSIPGASALTKLNAPGGGEKVTLIDPIGFPVHLVWGQQEKETTVPETNPENIQTLVPNYEDKKQRLGKFNRFQPGPAPVYRWGHYGVTYPPGMYQDMFDWYTQNLALSPSDITHDQKTGKAVCSFLHIDRGLEYSDHHSFFFKRAKPNDDPNVAHAAFEVHDFDIQHLGHDYLASKGYKLCWGIGRHVIGSQVFDYWFDPSGFVVEHYADGDMVNSETSINKCVAGPEVLSVWGPKIPEVF
ncbi:Glyoxalase/Bleomycin resistance protein/Dihydroxybiphenyl dioxygenase [Cadophora sp. DSE1049]|nr:Glyoxalase/Bleomycin resistance protein/Dihydroxybiphenyl dioxygenase [Cadophora sp. DSE1049]